MNKYDEIINTAINIICPGSRCTVSKVLEESVKEVLINKYGEGWYNNKERFYNAFNSIRTNFNVNTYTSDVPYLYSMYYMFLNVPKIELIILQLMKIKKLNRKLKILDIGSSVGTTSVAILDLFSLINNLCDLYQEKQIINSIVIDSIEGSRENIEVFNQNIKYYKNKLQEITQVDNITINEPMEQNIINYKVSGKYDLIIVSNMLNEIDYSDRKSLITSLEKNLKKSSEIIIIEPASKNSSILLNRLKYEISNCTKLNSIAPCGVCEECKQCWNFRTSDIVNGELISCLDNIYKEYNYSKFDEFYNNRLKWTYCILSNNLSKVIGTIGEKVNNNCSYNIKGNIVNYSNKIALCNSYGNKYIIENHDGNIGRLCYGDYIEFYNVQITSENKLIVNKDSIVKNLYNAKNFEKHRYKNIKVNNIEFILRRLWGYKKLREGQFEIISKALEGNDILGILPTGAGKSICYQLPAMLCNGLSIIISPLKSLMKDQVYNLHKIGFEFVDYIDSSKTVEEKKEVLNRFKAGSLKLLYLSPERLQMLSFQKELFEVLNNFNIDYFIIDEAHCASEWGHDFRPAYLKLRDVSDKLIDCNILAVTATASSKVKKDILDIFSIKEENVIKCKSLDRKEISLQVINLKQGEDKNEFLKKYIVNNLPEILNKNSIKEVHEHGSGIIFTIYSNGTGISTKAFTSEYISEVVKQEKIETRAYHSKLDDKIRENIQEEFIENKFPLLVSTKGFGMGIDKSNIRYIIHMCYSNSLEAYYQEAGRAGRDKEHAHSVIIATSRLEQCERLCNNIDSFEPPCINQWKCRFTGGIRCDYGMQAKFISGSYECRENMKKKINYFFNNIFLKAYKTRTHKLNFTFKVNNKYSSDYQKYLYYFQKFCFIKNYHIVDYISNYMINLEVEISENFSVNNIDEVLNKIIDRLQEFKKQKYNMLQVIWNYVNQRTQCRREFLMQYFGDDEYYNEEGCKFCDIEGISEEKAIATTSTLRVKKLYDEIMEYMKSNKFNLEKLKDFLVQSKEENILENIKIRSLRFLEDYMNNTIALFIVSTLTLKYDNTNAFARNQAYQLIDIFYKKNEVENIVQVFDYYMDIDNTLPYEILNRNKKVYSDKVLIKTILNTSSNKEWSDTVYKVYIKNKLINFNTILKRGN